MKDIELQTEAFKRYIEECDELSITPDYASAFNAAWTARAAIEADRAQRVPTPVSDREYLRLFEEARKGSDEPFGTLRGIRSCIAAYELSTPAPAQQEPSDENKALDLLAVLFDSYENGTPCYEDPEETTGYLGHAFPLDNETFHACADLLNRRRPVNGEPAAKHQAQPQQERGPMTDELQCTCLTGGLGPHYCERHSP